MAHPHPSVRVVIAADQPTIFGTSVVAGVSSAVDGMMKFAGSVRADVERSITNFTHDLNLTPDTLSYIAVTYDRPDFKRYVTIDRPEEPFHRIEADSVATMQKGIALFLPLADCTGAILYDPKNHALMLSHLGRHSTEQWGALASVRYMTRQFGSQPVDILVWLSPSPNGDVYPLWKRDNMSLIEANQLDLLEAGITPAHIEASTVDTVSDTNYFSHSEFLKGNRTEDGRFAIVAQLA